MHCATCVSLQAGRAAQALSQECKKLPVTCVHQVTRGAQKLDWVHRPHDTLYYPIMQQPCLARTSSMSTSAHISIAVLHDALMPLHIHWACVFTCTPSAATLLCYRHLQHHACPSLTGKKRKYYIFRRQSIDSPSAIPGCPDPSLTYSVL